VVGIALNKILIPQIRPFVGQEVNKEYDNLKTSHNIHVQTTSGRLQRWPPRKFLKYENINGNDAHARLPGGRYNYSLFDCRVLSHIDFARLYVENYVAKFNAFDEYCDASTVLLLLVGVPVFSAAVQAAAADVRMARNDWAHAVLNEWDQAKFQQTFVKLEHLVRAMALPAADEGKILGELYNWRTKDMFSISMADVRPGNHPETDDVYKMTAIPRGVALIINNESFGTEVELETRFGSEQDVVKLHKLFQELHFDVQTKRNLTRKQLLNELDWVACEDHSEYDCFVLWIMSHGTTGRVYCTDGNTLPVETVTDMLNNAACKTLRGKPKVCFIQACRGQMEDEVVVSQSQAPAHQRSDSPLDPNVPSSSSLPPSIAAHTDFLMAYSTVDGYVSYRNENEGSQYVRILVDVFRERVEHDHLVSILTKVNRKLSSVPKIGCLKGTSKAKHLVQVSEFVSRLTKDLYF